MTTRILKRPPAMLFRYRPPGEVANGYFDDLLRTNEFYPYMVLIAIPND